MLILVLVGFVGCLPKNDVSEPIYNTGIGTVENPTSSNLFTLIGDNGVRYIVKETNRSDFKPDTDARCVLTYKLLSENKATNEREIYLQEWLQVSVAGLLPLTAEVADTVGNDPVSAVQMYIISHFLNIDFTFEASGLKSHHFNMVRDSLIAPNSADTLRLEFRHNAHNDYVKYSFPVSMCFDISELKPFSANADSVPVIVSVTEYNYSEPRKYKLMYKF
jgi:hypothetical protein